MTTPAHASARPAARTARRAGRGSHYEAGEPHPCRPAHPHQPEPDVHEDAAEARAGARDAPPRADDHDAASHAQGRDHELLPHHAADPPHGAEAPREESGHYAPSRSAPAPSPPLFPHLPPGIQVLAYTPEQAAVLLAVRPSWLRRAAADGEVACTYLGKHLRFSDADLHAIIADNAAGPRPE